MPNLFLPARFPAASPMRRVVVETVAIVIAGCLSPILQPSRAQEIPWRTGTSFQFRRQVDLQPNGDTPSVVVTEFFTHGELAPDATNLTVFDRNGPVPSRLLQLGPGDFCRVAFETTPRQSTYLIYYGGESSAKGAQPAWTQNCGLLLETRRWKPCDLNSLDAVRDAFQGAQPLGSDFVPNVFHRSNPLASTPQPFLSLYSGMIQIDKAGKHQFFTSSQDASFLLIDGKQVVAAPGQHAPVHQARISGAVDLSAGSHHFEYWHVAMGDDACMVAAWQPPGTDKPTVIPPESFDSGRVVHRPANHLQHRAKGSLPDFTIDLLGEVPLADSSQVLVRAQFKDAAVKAVTMGAKLRWDFGDGQSSDRPNPEHVYLHPGSYTVGLSVQRGGKPVELANRIEVGRPNILENSKQKPDQLADYLPMLASYDARTLDDHGLVQLVRAFQQADQPAGAGKAGRVAFLPGARSFDDNVLHELAWLVGPTFRDQLNDAEAALEIWRSAAGKLNQATWRAECEIQAAEICLLDLGQPAAAKPLLQSAESRLAEANDPTLRSRLHRLWGDWYALTGNGESARSAYLQAAADRGPRGNVVEQNARRGAYSRSIESFLRDGETDRARDELRRWKDDFAADTIDGYVTLLEARYCIAVKKFVQAIAHADELLTVNPASPYADQLVLIAAECEEKTGRQDRAIVRYQSLVAQFPGSPLVELAREKVSLLNASTSTESRKPKK